MRKFKARIAALIIMAMVLSTVPAAAVYESYEPSDFFDGEVLVLLEDGTTELIIFETEAELEKGVKELAVRPDVEWLQPNFTYEISGYPVNDPYFSKQWALFNDGGFNEFNMTVSTGADINITQAWESYGGAEKRVTIALIDTGADVYHEDLSGAFWVNEGEIPGNGIDDDGNGFIDDINGWNFYDGNNVLVYDENDGHGTHCAGIMAARTDNGIGIAGITGLSGGNIDIMVLKVLGGEEGKGRTDAVIYAIKYAEMMGADIVNLSLGNDAYDRILYFVMESSPLLFVVAAGNESKDLDRTPSYPASFGLENMISVAGIGADGELAGYSNYGHRSVDIAAPGTAVLSTVVGSGYEYYEGTSMAAPMVAGAAALALSHYGDMSAAELKALITESAGPRSRLSGYVVNGALLDAGALLEYYSWWKNPFSDVKQSDWYYEYVKFVWDNGLMSGTGTGFSPAEATTRGMLVTILYRHYGSPEISGENVFTDVAGGEYYADAVAWAAENKITEGYGDGRFGPSDGLTRQQMAAILYRYAAFLGKDVGGDTAALGVFSDAMDISDYAAEPMAWAVSKGIISGMGDGKVAPGSGALRCQLAAVLTRFCSLAEEAEQAA